MRHRPRICWWKPVPSNSGGSRGRFPAYLAPSDCSQTLFVLALPQIAVQMGFSAGTPKRSRRICQQRFWPQITRHLPESGFLRYHIHANEAAGAGYSVIRAENPQTLGLAGGEGGIRTLGTGYPVRQISNLVPSTTRPPLRSANPSTYALGALAATLPGCDAKNAGDFSRACGLRVRRALWSRGAALIYQSAPHLVKPHRLAHQIFV